MTVLHDTLAPLPYLNGESIANGEILVDDSDENGESVKYSNGSIYPYDLPEEVDIREDPQTIFEWLRKLNRNLLITDPEFQRNLVWKLEQKSQFIESILLGFPLPPLYVNQNIEGKYIIVDGLQRTSTLDEFVNDRFALKNLELLEKLNFKCFKDLSPALQARIEDKKLFIYIIKPSVPLPMVYDIFHRINTGGTQLTRQEIRNCFYLGQATRLLKELSKHTYFKQAIDQGISSTRMKDREAILRCLAFWILSYQNDYKNNMDAFLGEAMKLLNNMDEAQIEHWKQQFERVMRLTFQFFGHANFRLPTENARGRINIAVMETICNFFLQRTDEFLLQNQTRIQENFQKLLNKSEYIDATRFSTGDTKRVITRFEVAQQILGEVG